MTSEPQSITQGKFRMWRRPDGIVHLVWVAGSHITLEDATQATAAMEQLTGGQPAGLVVDAHNSSTMDRAARMEFVRRVDLVSAVALVVTTPLSRLMGNFFIAINSPAAPTRLFDDDASAIAWLQGVVS